MTVAVNLIQSVTHAAPNKIVITYATTTNGEFRAGTSPGAYAVTLSPTPALAPASGTSFSGTLDISPKGLYRLSIDLVVNGVVVDTFVELVNV